MIALILALAHCYCLLFGYKGFIHNNDALFCAAMFETVLELFIFVLIQGLKET